MTTPTDAPIVRLTDVVKAFTAPDGSRREVLRIDDFAIAPGEQVALTGRSGSGKTTLLNVIAGLQRPDEGRVELAGVDLGTLREPAVDRLRAATIGMVFQTFNLLPGFTALENVELAMQLAGRADRSRARALLDRVGLTDRLHDTPAKLSIGQQQRVAVARALANSPRLIVADEPTGSLDAATAESVFALIREVCRESSAALLAVSHDPAITTQLDRAMPMSEVNRPTHPTAV
jgi:ABC-type lipoprotein export system ATPase subunit